MWGAFFAVSSALSSVVLIAVFIAPYPERINWLFCLGVWALTVFCFFKFREEFEKEKEEQERHVASRINAEKMRPRPAANGNKVFMTMFVISSVVPQLGRTTAV